MNECQIAPLLNGSLLLAARTGNFSRMTSLSTDKGETWGASKVVPGLSGYATCEASLMAHRRQLFFSHPQAQSREKLTIRRSSDDGDTWPAGAADQLLVHAGASAYSSLGSTAKGELAVLWELDGKDLGFATTTKFN